MTTPSPLQTLREALVEAKESNRKAVVHSSDPFIITHAGTTQSALTRAEAALRELEAEPRYTVEEVLEVVSDAMGRLYISEQSREVIKRRLAAAKEEP